jgi:tetratricopeptide (TPR) repeat protein
MRSLLLSLMLLTACSTGESRAVPLFDGLGDHQHAITTATPETQAYFDQGLRLTYAFNHEEAIRSFRYALELDPGCAMCWWGIAFAAGPNINATMDEIASEVAWDAIQYAVALAPDASEAEGAYIDALAERYGPDLMAERAAKDSAFAVAMSQLADRFPEDDDAQVLYADALMNLAPWDYWNADETPRAGTEEILSALERVVERSPQHAGACHSYIHAVEKVDPERAVPCAERLSDLMPSAGHIVHMPAHIFIRVGRYVEAIEHNHTATHADELYLDAEGPGGMYPLAYYPHNYDFLAFAAAMAGHRAEALEAARSGALAVDHEMMTAPELGGLQNFLLLPLRMMTRFGMWEEILEEPVPETDQDFVVGFSHYARGMALLRTGRSSDAAAELEMLRARLDSPGIDPYVVWWNPAGQILTLGALALEAEILNAAGDDGRAVALLEQAVALEDDLVYDEPPPWSIPSRQVLGRIHFERDRFAEAEAVFRADLAKYPENGWSLYGLTQALGAQGEGSEAATIMARYERAWSTADVEPVTGTH